MAFLLFVPARSFNYGFAGDHVQNLEDELVV